ncbi:hypothetical protein [Natronomonas amylolytica]|uniref:hypothetical protein n=1 Tax=Natronomonas amylolytica TaxID=3108498 RepID=UPI0030094A1D
MAGVIFERARKIRDSNAILALIFFAIVIAIEPFVAIVTEGLPTPSETVLSISWAAGSVLLSGYGVCHLLAALADTEQFLDEYGTKYASAAIVFFHALGQRLFVVVAVGFALVLFAILGTGVDAPFALLTALGLFGALLLGPPTAIPMNRRVSEKLSEYRHS